MRAQRPSDSPAQRDGPSTHPRRYLVLLFLALAASRDVPAWSQNIRDDLYVTNGTVFAAAVSGSTLYIGGDFTRVGPATGSGIPLDAATGIQRSGFPKVIGQVMAVAPDDAGGWYIGGSFTSVGELPRSNLAHILADYTVSEWNPAATGGGSTVWALGLNAGIVYVGGSFTSVGGQPRNRVAAVDAATGTVTPWNPSAAGGSVHALVVRGNSVYVGGTFTSIGGQVRNRIAALDVATGGATGFDPNADDDVLALALDGLTVYAGGYFGIIGGRERTGIAALDAATGTATAWDPHADSGSSTWL
jgi:beta-propeller uncharacterized protein DUF5122